MGRRGEFLMQLGCKYWGVSFIYVTFTCTLPFGFAFNVLCMTLLCKNNGLYLLRNFTQERDPLQENVKSVTCTVLYTYFYLRKLEACSNVLSNNNIWYLLRIRKLFMSSI